MKLELITKSKEEYEESKRYCEVNKLKFIDLGTTKKLGVTEYLYDIVGTKKQIEKFEDDHIIIY